jgi:hypothetical protein
VTRQNKFVVLVDNLGKSLPVDGHWIVPENIDSDRIAAAINYDQQQQRFLSRHQK